MKRLLFFLFLIFHLTAHTLPLPGAELLPQEPVAPALFPALEYKRQGKAHPLPLEWRYITGDKSAYASPSFDDSAWQKVTVGRSFKQQGWMWYRIAFNLPQDLERKSLLLTLGAISVSDQVFVNGTKVAEFGGRPPAFVQRASDVTRVYPVPANRWRAGPNTIAIRVYSGAKGGMHRGPYTVQAYDDNLLYTRFSQKLPGPDALETLLFDSALLQRFTPGSPIIVEPRLTRLNAGLISGSLIAELLDASGKVLETDSVKLDVRGMRWSGAQFRFRAAQHAGRYTCRLRYIASGESLWFKELPFKIGSQPVLSYELPRDPSIKTLPEQACPASVHTAAVGRYGPREVGNDFVLFDDVSQTDARSGMAYSAQIEMALGAPRLFLANTRPVPKNRVTRFHRVAGHVYDGLSNAWVYGGIRPSGEAALERLEVKQSSWVQRTYRYLYKGSEEMDFTLSAISPAWRAQTDANRLSVFYGIEQHGIGLPSRLAFQSTKGVKIVAADEGISGSEMTANWVLAWFEGGAGWEEFDTPYLFVLEKRPREVRSIPGDALRFDYAKPAGIVQGMPLYGVTLLPLSRTRSWRNELPASVITLCDLWSRALVCAPEMIDRFVGADFDNDLLLVRDKVSHLAINDDWKTEGFRIAPVSPTLALSAKAGKIDVASGQATRDFGMATLHGPYVAVENSNEVTFRIKGLLRWLERPREAAPAVAEEKAGSVAAAVRAELNRIVAEGLETELKAHPWPAALRHETFIIGRHRARYSNLLLSLPYLEPALRTAVEREIVAETESYFLNTETPPQTLAARLNPKDRELPLLLNIHNPVTGKTLATAPYGLTRFGIDQPYFGAMSIYMSWHYAEALGRFAWLSAHYPTLQRLFDTVRNSHDWATGVSWDSFSGLRVGNGHQESSGIHAAMLAMLRTARKLNDSATAHKSAYYAHMQLVGMQAQLYASDYLRENRPWLYANTRREQIEYAQRIRGNYFAEFNEFAGLSQAIISSGNRASRPDNLSGSSPNGLVESPLPEVMRLYQTLWPDFINDFYHPRYDALIRTDRVMDSTVSVDTFVYQIAQYPQSIHDIFQARRQGHFDWWIRMTDHRAYLDYLGFSTRERERITPTRN